MSFRVNNRLGSVAVRPGGGSSPFFVNFSSALGIGVTLTYFVKFGAAADYYFPIYIKKYKAIRITVSGGGEIRSRIRAGKLPAS